MFPRKESPARLILPSHEACNYLIRFVDSLSLITRRGIRDATFPETEREREKKSPSKMCAKNSRERKASLEILIPPKLPSSSPHYLTRLKTNPREKIVSGDSVSTTKRRSFRASYASFSFNSGKRGACRGLGRRSRYIDGCFSRARKTAYLEGDDVALYLRRNFWDACSTERTSRHATLNPNATSRAAPRRRMLWTLFQVFRVPVVATEDGGAVGVYLRRRVRLSPTQKCRSLDRWYISDMTARFRGDFSYRGSSSHNNFSVK